MTKKKLVLFFVFCLSLSSIFLGCAGDGGSNSSDSSDVTPPPVSLDADGDTVLDANDCAPNDSTKWQTAILYQDLDGDSLPESAPISQQCVGNTALPDWTFTSGPPWDPCPNDAQNTCNTSNTPPTVNILSPANNSTYVNPGNLTVITNPADSDGTIQRVEILLNGSITATAFSTPWQVVVPVSVGSNQKLQAIAYDDDGAVGASAIINFTIEDTPNDPPVVNIITPSQGQQFNVGDNVTIQVTATDDGQIIQVVFSSGSTQIGTRTSVPYSVTWNNVPAGSHTINIVATDNGGLTGQNSVTINVSAQSSNNPPNANPDNYTMDENNILNVSSANGVLNNDNDPDGDNMTAVIYSGAVPSGTLNLGSNGNLTFTPAQDYNGTITFRYRAYDGTDFSAPVTVTITVNPVNDPPTAVNDSYTMDENSILTVSTANGVLSNDTDPENNPLTAILQSQPSNGTVILNTNGSFTYTPNSEFSDNDQFTYVAVDTGFLSSNIATVTITVNPVNDAPVANNDTYTVTENQQLLVGAPGVLANDTDPDSPTLTAIQQSQATNGFAIIGSNGSVDYTPNPEFNGTDSVSYIVTDGVNTSNVATVTFNVAAVNDPPVANPDNYSINENLILVVTAANGVLANDSDPENDTMIALQQSPASNGIAIIGFGGSLLYAPNPGFDGTDSVTYLVTDGVNISNTTTVTFTVFPVNNQPIANPDSYSTNENTQLTVPAISGLLANDTDLDGDVLTAVLYLPPLYGSVVIQPNGSFIYTPLPGFNLTDTFQYRAFDGQVYSAVATVTITVNPVNTPPVANPDSYSVSQGGTLNVPVPGVLANDTDADIGDILTSSLMTLPSNGSVIMGANGSFIYTNTSISPGTDTFTYRVSDGTVFSNTTTVTITVTGVNNPPVANPDSYSVSQNSTLSISAPGIWGNDTDANGDSLTVILVSGPNNTTFFALNSNGSFTLTPNTNFNETITFTYMANDGQANSNVATVTVMVLSTNNIPVAVSDIYDINENQILITTAADGVMSNDTDADGDPLTAILLNGPTNGTLIAFNDDGSFIYEPNTDIVSVDMFTYLVNDGTDDSNVATVTINVVPHPYLQIFAELDLPAGSITLSAIGTCCEYIGSWGVIGSANDTTQIVINCALSQEAVQNHECLFAINIITPTVQTICGGASHWLPYQCGNPSVLYDGLNGGGLLDMHAYVSFTGNSADEMEVFWGAIPNDQDGGNYLVDLDQAQTAGGSWVDIIVGIPMDTDGDFILNPFDNCIVVYNPLQTSTPGNPLGANGLPVGNACIPLPDPDNDGWLSCPGATPPLPSGCDAAPNDPFNH